MITAKKIPLKKEKKSPSIDIPHISKSNIEQVAAITLKPTGKFLGVNNDIVCTRFYVDSAGDTAKIGKIDGRTIIEFDFSDSSIEQMENASMFNTNDEISSGVRKPRIKIESDMVELAEISLGNWRNTISKIENIEQSVIGKRVYYDKTTNERKEKDNGNTSFKTILMCNSANVEATKALLKDIFKKHSKVAVEWL